MGFFEQLRQHRAAGGATPGVNRARQLEHHLDAEQRRHRNVLEAGSDEHSSYRLYRRSLGRGGILKLGQIVYSVPPCRRRGLAPI
jgi:hypothetical protein